MKITVEFDSEEEFKARIKNPRGAGKGAADDNDAGNSQAAGSGGMMHPGSGGAPAPMMPPQGQPGFNPQPQTFAPSGGPSFPGGGQTAGVDPAVQALVTRVVNRIDAAIASGQPADGVTQWFRTECTRAGVDATSATLDQIKTLVLPKLAMPALENIAKLMGA